MPTSAGTLLSMIVNVDPVLMEFIVAASEGVRTVLDCADRLVGPSDSDSHLHAVALHATLTELLSGCVVLALHEHPTGIPILLRSMYEALVDLDNLLHVPGYMGRMEAANLTQVVKLLEASKSNPLLRGIDDVHGARLDEFRGRRRAPAHYRSRSAARLPTGCSSIKVYIGCLASMRTAIAPRLEIGISPSHRRGRHKSHSLA